MPDDSNPGRLLAALAEQVPGARGAVLLSRAGLALAGHGLGTDSADQLAALTAALFSHVRQAAARLGCNDGVRQVVIESDGVMLFAVTAGAAHVLAALADRGTDAAALADAMSEVAGNVQPFLAAQPRMPGAATRMTEPEAG